MPNKATGDGVDQAEGIKRIPHQDHGFTRAQDIVSRREENFSVDADNDVQCAALPFDIEGYIVFGAGTVRMDFPRGVA